MVAEKRGICCYFFTGSVHKMKNKNQRLLRWSLMLQEHNLDIRHIRGRDNIIPDTLSRA